MRLAAGGDDDLAEQLGRLGVGIGFEHSGRAPHFGGCRVLARSHELQEFFDEAAHARAVVGVAADRDLVAAHVHLDIGVLVLDRS